jgi:hypothetical protein
MQAELCRSVAYEALRRGAHVNVHELWAALEAVNDVQPRLIVDIGSGPAVLWAWWSTGAQVIGVSGEMGAVRPAFSGERLPEAVIDLVGDPREPSTVLRVLDQLAVRSMDVLVLGLTGTEDTARTVYRSFVPHVRERGLVLVHGIADRSTPGVGAFWRGLDPAGRKELVGSVDPIGYGIVEIHGKDRAAHA